MYTGKGEEYELKKEEEEEEELVKRSKNNRIARLEQDRNENTEEYLSFFTSVSERKSRK